MVGYEPALRAKCASHVYARLLGLPQKIRVVMSARRSYLSARSDLVRSGSFSTDLAGFDCRSMSALLRKATYLPRGNEMTRRANSGHARQKSWLGAVLVQADALLISHIAPGRRTLAPSAWGASASRREMTAAETTSAGWLRNQLFTAPIWVD